MLESELNSAKHAKNSGVCRKNTVKRIAALDKKLIKKRKLLSLKKKANVDWKYRTQKKQAIRKLVTANANVAKEWKVILPFNLFIQFIIDGTKIFRFFHLILVAR